MSVIQVNVPADVKARADAAFARNGITTPAAMKMMVTQVANSGRTPLDGAFLPGGAAGITDEMRRDMVRVEAQEYGLIPDDAYEYDPSSMPQEALDILGLTAEELGL